jgi:hypothetical protein
MNINFQVEADFDLAKIPLRGWDRQLKESAEVVEKDHVERLERGKGVSGDQLRALKESTIRKKQRMGYRAPSKPLVAEGIMQHLESDKRVTKLKNREKISLRVTTKKGKEKPKQSRRKIGKFHQEGTDAHTIEVKKKPWLVFEGTSRVVATKKVQHPGMKPRVWFGISDKAFEDIAMIFTEEVSRRIQTACLEGTNPLSHIAGYSVSA